MTLGDQRVGYTPNKFGSAPSPLDHGGTVMNWTFVTHCSVFSRISPSDQQTFTYICTKTSKLTWKYLYTLPTIVIRRGRRRRSTRANTNGAGIVRIK